MTTETRNERIESAIDLVAWQARRFTRMPRGITLDDLESAGGEALIHAATTWDEGHGVPWRTYARVCIRNAMKSAIRAARSRRHAPLEVEAEDGRLLPRVDPGAMDPADRAAAREMIATPGAGRRHVSLSGAPAPAEVAIRAASLREAMFAAIGDGDAAEIVRIVAEKAKKGDLKAARLFFDLLAPARSGIVVHQQAIVINHGDLGDLA